MIGLVGQGPGKAGMCWRIVRVKLDGARTHAKEYLRLYPGVSLQHLAKNLPYKCKLDLDHLLDGLRKAGLPE